MNFTTPYNPPTLPTLRRYNVNRPGVGCCAGVNGLGDLGNGEFLEREAYYQRLAEETRQRTAAMTPEQLAAKAELDAAIKEAAAWRAEWARGVEPGRNLGNMYLTARGKKLRAMIVNRNWPALFRLFPLLVAPGETNASGPGVWRPEWAISKYSFRGDGPNKVYVPWTRADIRSFVFSPYYTVKPGHDCTDAQRELGVQALWEAQARHKQKFTSASYAYVWPIYPGSGYGWQTFGCMPDKQSWWVKNREKVVGAALVTTAIFLGPQIISAVTGGGASGTGAAATGAGAGTTAATTTGIVGAGTKAGAITATVTTKATVGAAITTKSLATAATIKGAVEAGTLFSKTQSAVELLNKARSVDAIIKGELPPPPIGISGSNFTEWALDLAKTELRNELQERAGEYLTKKMQEKIIAEQEARLRAEIEALQRELAGLVPEGTPVEPSHQLDPDVRAKLMEMQAIEQERQRQSVALLALGAGAVFVMS